MDCAHMGGMCQRLAPYAQSLLRISAGLILFTSGTTKVFSWPGSMPPGVQLSTQLTIGAWLEVVFGALIMLGLLTRISAFLMSGMMAVAYWQFHAFGGGSKLVSVWPTVNGGGAAAVMCFVFLYFAASGAGRWGVDALICKPKAETPAAPEAKA